MKKAFCILLVFSCFLSIPFLCQAATVILSNSFQDTTLTAGSETVVYGTTDTNHITLEIGAKAELFNFPGNNTITIQADSSLFTVSRSGAYVTFEGTEGTTLKIPATLETQTISFNDRKLSLVIDSGKVMLGNQEIDLGGGDPGTDPDSLCNDTCLYAGDGVCDDGGEGSDYSVCTLGSDCSDCGDRGGPGTAPGNELEKTRTVGLGSDVTGFLDTSTLKVLSNSGESAFSSSGSASIGFLHDDENVPNPTLLMVTNEAGNPILLKMSDDLGKDFTVSSTALALVLYDLNILFLAHEDYVRVRTAVQADTRLATLTADIKALIQAKDPNPLDYDSHPAIYQQAVTIAQDALKDIAPIILYHSSQSDNEIQPLEVIDDKEKTADVVLTNRTMCYYDIKASKDGVALPTYRIERRNLLDYHIVNWPLELSPGVDFEVTSKVNIGDGNLSFAFEKQKKLTVVYCMLSAASTAIGVGSTKLADIEKGFEALASAGGEVTSLISKMLTTKPNNQDEANKLAAELIYGVFHSGYTLVSIVFETQIKEQLKHNFLKTAFKIAGSKLIVLATTGYAASDIAVTLWDLHYAPEAYSEEGYQVSGEYPVRLTLINVEPNSGKPGDEITVDFDLKIPTQVIPAKLMLGDLEVAKIYDSSQRQLIFPVPEGAKTGILKFTYSNAESKGVPFTVGDPAGIHSGIATGESHTVYIDDDKSPDETVKMAITANWQVDTGTGITVSSHSGYLDYFDSLYTTTILFDLDPPGWTKPNQGNFTITLENTPIKDVTESYSYILGGWWGNVTFGKPYYTIDSSPGCSRDRPIEESGIEFSFSQNDNVITGSYLFPGSGQGTTLYLLLNIPYTVTRPDDPYTTADESYTAIGVCQPQGSLLLFRNYDTYDQSDPCYGK